MAFGHVSSQKLLHLFVTVRPVWLIDFKSPRQAIVLENVLALLSSNGGCRRLLAYIFQAGYLKEAAITIIVVTQAPNRNARSVISWWFGRASPFTTLASRPRS